MADLNDLREKIDHIDRSIIEALRERFLAVGEIGKLKSLQNLPPLDATRWQKVLASRLAWAEELGVNKDFVKKVLDLIHAQSLEIEDKDNDSALFKGVKRHKIANRLDNFNEYVFAQLARKVSDVEQRKKRKVLNFGPGNPDYPPAEEYLAKYQEFIAETGSSFYPGYGAIKEFATAIVGWYKKRFKVDLKDGEYYPLLGGKDGLSALSLALLDEEDEVLVPDPGYPGFVGPALMAGAHPVSYDLLPEQEFKINLDQLNKKLSSKTKAIWINFPSNPTGQVASLEELKPLVDFAKQKGVWLLYDNAYAEITYDNFVAPSILEIPGAKDVAIEIGSFSKMFSFAGFRMGWIAGNSELIAAVAKVKSQLDSGMSRPLQKLGYYALTNYNTDWNRAMLESYESRRNIIAQKLKSIGLTFSLPRGALYLWAKIPDQEESADQFCDRLLEEKQISLVPGTAYGKNGERYVRASFCINIDKINDYF